MTYLELDYVQDASVQGVTTMVRDRYEKWIEKKVTLTVSENLKIYKVAFWSFIAGFMLFLTLGLVNEGAIFRTIIKSLYPPKEIYKDVVNEFLKDEEFKNSLVHKTDYSKLEIKGASFETFPQLNEKLPEKVWNTMAKGSSEDYSEFVSRDEFFEALKSYHTELTESFLVPSNSKVEILSKLEKVMDIEIDVLVLMAGENAHTAQTANCYNWFENDSYHVELVIPKTYSAQELSWFRCDFAWPEMYLTLTVDGSELPTPVKLVGARRNGNSNKPVLLISQKIAQDLKLHSWERFLSKAYGSISINEVK